MYAPPRRNSRYPDEVPPLLKRGTPVIRFLVFALIIIIALVVLYYVYNFLFKSGAAGSPDVIISRSIQTSQPFTAAVPAFKLPYEGGDYTVSFWLYVNSNTFVNGGYRKHIVDIGGDVFSTVAIGLDAYKNNLIVRTHTGDTDPTGMVSTSTSSTTSTTTTSGPNTTSTTPYVTAGGQTFYGGVLPGATTDFDSPCYSFDLTNGFQLKTGGTADTGCKTTVQLRKTGVGLKCTEYGIIDISNNNKNMGWSSSCNPCAGYWVKPNNWASWWSGLMGSSSTDNSTYRSYDSGANANPCRSMCRWSEDGKFAYAEVRSDSGSGSGSDSGSGAGGSFPPRIGIVSTGSGVCNWYNLDALTTATTSSSGSGSSSSSSSNTSTTYSTSSVPGCAATTTLSTSTMKQLFDTSVATADCDPLPSCDVPNIDLQRWTLVTVVLSGRTTDVHINGKLSRSCVAKSYYKVDVANTRANVLKYRRFDGQISNLNFYNTALNPGQIYDMYTKGPSM